MKCDSLKQCLVPCKGQWLVFPHKNNEKYWKKKEDKCLVISFIKSYIIMLKTNAFTTLNKFRIVFNNLHDTR